MRFPKHPYRRRSRAARQLSTRRVPVLAEAMEGRLLLSGWPVLSEFLAANDTGRLDVFGDRSDWIELFNPTASPIDLAGYRLTDDPAQAAKWTFPAVALEPGAYLVVAASGRDLREPQRELHTNFRLDAAGEYLALVAPDGTIVSEYAPSYPEQLADVSYGVATDHEVTTLVPDNGAMRYLAPAGSGGPGAEWRSTGFDDAGWTAGFLGAGYQFGGLSSESEPNNTIAGANDAAGNFQPTSEKLYHMAVRGSFGTTEDWFRIGAFRSGDVLTVAEYGLGANRASLADPIVELWRGAGASPTLVASDDNGGSGNDALIYRFTLTADDTYYVHAKKPAGQGAYEIGLWLENPAVAPSLGSGLYNEAEGNNTAAQANNASASWRAVQHRARTAGASTANDVDVFRYEFQMGDSISVTLSAGAGMDASVAISDASGAPMVREDGSSTLPAGSSGDSSFYGFVAPASGAYYITVRTASGSGGTYTLDVHLSSATTPPAPDPYRPLIGTDVSAAMAGRSSLYLRIPFTVEDPAEFDALRLRMRYDDGFVAHINGQEVARRNAPQGEPTSGSFATGRRSNAEAMAFEDITLPAAGLAAGRNVLAIHGLNAADDTRDLLMAPVLEGITVRTGVQRYFTRPTPGAANDISSIYGIVGDTHFDHDRGFYDAPFDVALSTATPGAVIRYTVDGSAPTATSGTVYTGPVRIATTTVLRAAAFKAGYLPSDVDTQTYLFLNDVLRQPVSPAGFPAIGSAGVHWDYEMDPAVVQNPLYNTELVSDLKAIPTLSLVMNKDDLFSANGIYTNPTQSGMAWERPGSAELIYADGREGFQIDSGVRIYGGVNRNTRFPKHSFRLIFRDIYGAGKLRFPIFQDALYGDTATDEFDTLVLRGQFNNSWPFWVDTERNRAQYVHDAFAAATQLAMGEPAIHQQFVHLYIDGLYWGLYAIAERPSAPFLASYLGGEKEDYDALNSSEPIDGTKDAWNTLHQLVNAGVTSLPAYEQIQQYLDVDNFIDYMILNFYGGNQDWDDHNWYAGRKREPGAGYQFFSWDGERILEDPNADRTEVNQADKPSRLHNRLRQFPEYALRFADRVQKHFFNDGALTSQSALERYYALANTVRGPVVGESARWGDFYREQPYTRNAEWQTEQNRLVRSYFPARTQNVLNQLVADGLYPSVSAPSFNQHGGAIAAGFRLTISAPAGQIWYTLDGADPRQPGGATSPSARIYSGPIPLDWTTQVKARVLLNNTWSALNEALFSSDLSALRITEFMYNPAEAQAGGDPVRNNYEYIELQNTGGSAINLLGVHFDEGVEFAFPSLVLAGGQRVLVVANRAAFESRYGAGLPIAGEFQNGTRLEDNGERITLAGPGGTILSFRYSDNWYPITDGDGYSMVAVNAAGAANSFDQKEAWRPSNLAGGAPGQADPGIAPGSIVINEVMTHTDQPEGDWIELYNAGAVPINLSGWFVSDDPADLTKFRIPEMPPLQAGQYIVFNERDGFGNPAVAARPFSLSLIEGRVILSNNDGADRPAGYREEVDFRGAEKEMSFGRFIKLDGTADFTPLQLPTPNTANSGARVGPLVINELMYNPLASGSEFIELRNISAQGVSMAGWRVTDGVTYEFPADAAAPAMGFVLVVPIDPALFRQTWLVPEGAVVYGPYEGKLADEGEDVTLSRPVAGGGYLRVDRVRYGDTLPWPPQADGTGASLSRLQPGLYGNDAGNWAAGPMGGTPGSANRQEAPTVDLGADPVLQVGEGLRRTGTFQDGNIDQTWTGTIRWGDKADPEPLQLDLANHAFTLDRTFIEPGTYVVTVTITDSLGAWGSDSIAVTVLPEEQQGGEGADTYILRRDSTGQFVQFFINSSTSQPPAFAIRHSLLPPLVFRGGGGEDVLSVDLAYGNPIPAGGVTFDGGDGADLIRIIGSAASDEVIASAEGLVVGNFAAETWSVEQVRFDGQGGDDRMTVSSALAALPLFNGGSGNDTLRIEAGQYVLPADLYPGSMALELVVAGQSAVSFASSQHVVALRLEESGRVAMLSGAGVLRVRQLAVAPNAQLDLADNAMILDLSAGAGNDALGDVTGWISTGRHDGDWAGMGITSSAAAADPDGSTLGVMRNDRPSRAVFVSRFAGEPVDANDILVRFTRMGDADLNATADADDYFRIDEGFLRRLDGYREGDFNFDGQIDGDDYAMIDHTARASAFAMDDVAAAPQRAVARPAASAAPGMSLHAMGDIMAGRFPAEGRFNERTSACRDLLDEFDADDGVLRSDGDRGR